MLADLWDIQQELIAGGNKDTLYALINNYAKLILLLYEKKILDKSDLETVFDIHLGE